MNNIIENFIKKFYGYGRFSDDYWFIGMEEGMSAENQEEQINEFEHRLLCWGNRGQIELEDLVEYHNCLAKNCKNINRFFENGKPPLQETWSKLIRLQLVADGKEINNEEIREYQRKGLSETCLIELFPLPSKNTGEWIYDKYASNKGLGYLQSRTKYREEIVNTRLKFIKEKIIEHKPKVVVCYGLMYLEYFKQLKIHNDEWVKVTVKTGKKEEFFWKSKHEDGVPLLLIIKHPSTIGVTNKYFEKIGSYVSSMAIKK